MSDGPCRSPQLATEENDTWGRGLTFPNTSVHRLLSIIPIAAVPLVRTSKAYEKIERRSPILRGGNLQRPQAVLSTPFPTSAAHEHPPFACSQPSHKLMGGGGPPGACEVQFRTCRCRKVSKPFSRGLGTGHLHGFSPWLAEEVVLRREALLAVFHNMSDGPCRSL